MAEVLVQFDPPLTDESGRTYVARVCGRETDDGLWEGWIEFDPQDGGPTLRTPRETDQPKRSDLEYWATGLTVTYLEGALARARDPRTPDLRPRTVEARPAHDRPSPPTAAQESSAIPNGIRPNAVLDPFAVYLQGEDVLRDELSALDEGHLRNVIRAYGLAREDELDLAVLHRTALSELIVASVRSRAV